MSLLTLILECLGVIIPVIILTVAYFKYTFTYWDKMGVPTLKQSLRIPWGHMKDLFLGRVGFDEQFKRLYQEAKRANLKHVGLYAFASKQYMPVAPEVLKLVLQKDFQHFVNHGTYLNERDDPLNANLFALEDEEWRAMRVKLTPTFTSGKMKMMFEIFVSCAENLEEVLNKQENSPVDIKEILACFTTDIIASTAFGIEAKSLQNPEAEFRKFGRMIFDLTFFETLKMMSTMFIPRRFLQMIKLKLIRDDVEEFFLTAVQRTVEYREKNSIHRKDFMQLLIDLKNRGNVDEDPDEIQVDSKQETNSSSSMTLKQLAAQAFVFFVGGFETSSTLMTFAIYELCVNPEVQEKLRKEIFKVLDKHQGRFTYEAVMEMTYLEKVLLESLRKYPPLSAIPRICTKDYTIPGIGGRILKGTPVAIAIMGVHYDEEYYPDPEVFDPERFSEENKAARPPCTFLPFGEGPRMCIGMRFGLLQSKLGLATILRNFRIALSEKTQRPLKFKVNNPFLAFDNTIWLDMEKIK